MGKSNLDTVDEAISCSLQNREVFMERRVLDDVVDECQSRRHGLKSYSSVQVQSRSVFKADERGKQGTCYLWVKRNGEAGLITEITCERRAVVCSILLCT